MKARANHIGPESCVADREVWCEALTAVPAGKVASRERLLGRDADAVGVAEGSTAGASSPAPCWSRVVADLGMPAKPFVWEPGDLMPGRLKQDSPHREGRRAETGDARA